MSGTSRDEASGIDAEATTTAGTVAALETANTYLLYDRDDHRAWLESDLSLALDGMR